MLNDVLRDVLDLWGPSKVAQSIIASIAAASVCLVVCAIAIPNQPNPMIEEDEYEH